MKCQIEIVICKMLKQLLHGNVTNNRSAGVQRKQENLNRTSYIKTNIEQKAM